VGDNNSIRLELLPVRRRVKRRGGLGVRQAQAERAHDSDEQVPELSVAVAVSADCQDIVKTVSLL
jgi:hypothetical protein